jgi:hypothetical protein
MSMKQYSGPGYTRTEPFVTKCCSCSVRDFRQVREESICNFDHEEDLRIMTIKRCNCDDLVIKSMRLCAAPPRYHCDKKIDIALQIEIGSIGREICV